MWEGGGGAKKRKAKRFERTTYKTALNAVTPAQRVFNYQQLFIALTAQLTCAMYHPVGHKVDPTVCIF